MTAYVVVYTKSIKDEEAIKRYRQLAMDVLPKQNVRFVAGPIVNVGLEGGPFESAVILEFDSVEQAKTWYYSPEYQELADIRIKASDSVAFIVDQFPV